MSGHKFHLYGTDEEKRRALEEMIAAANDPRAPLRLPSFTPEENGRGVSGIAPPSPSRLQAPPPDEEERHVHDPADPVHVDIGEAQGRAGGMFQGLNEEPPAPPEQDDQGYPLDHLVPPAQQAPATPPEPPVPDHIRAGQLFDAMHAGDGPEEGPSTRYADEAKKGYRQSDADLRRMWMANGMADAVIGDGSNTRSQALALGHQMQSGYDENLQNAQHLDELVNQHRPTPATRADAEIAQQAYGLSPEGAASINPNAKNLPSIGPMAQRRDLANLKSQDTHATLEQRDRAGQLRSQDTHATNASREGVAAANRKNQMDLVGARTQGQLQVIGQHQTNKGNLDPDVMAAHILAAKTPGHDYAQAAQRVQDEPDDPEVQAATTAAQALASDPKKGLGVLGNLVQGQAGVQNATDKAAGNPQQLSKEYQRMSAKILPFKDAYRGVKLLEKTGKLNLLGQLGQQGPAGMIGNKLMTDEEAAAGGAILQFMGAYAHGQYGANFTKAEQQMFSKLSGVKFGGGWDPTAHPSVTTSFFERMKEFLKQDRAATLKFYPGLANTQPE